MRGRQSALASRATNRRVAPPKDESRHQKTRSRPKKPKRYRVPVAGAAVIALGAGALGGAAAATASGEDGPLGNYSAVFDDREQQFCASDGVMEYEIALIDEELEQGFASPEAAVEAWETDLRSAASFDEYRDQTGREVSGELFDLLAPSRDFSTSISSESLDGLSTYFDVPSSRDGVLEARLVVTEAAGSYIVSEAFRCESSVVADLDRFQALWAEELNR